jgi:four helix bundle protein
MQDFKNVLAWRRAHRLALAVRQATQRYPKNGYASQKSQMIRAAESIPSNIVEGCGSSTRRELARFLDISLKSSTELEGWLVLARDCKVFSFELWRSLTAETIRVRQLTFRYKESVLRADEEERG